MTESVEINTNLDTVTVFWGANGSTPGVVTPAEAGAVLATSTTGSQAIVDATTIPSSISALQEATAFASMSGGTALASVIGLTGAGATNKRALASFVDDILATTGVPAAIGVSLDILSAGNYSTLADALSAAAGKILIIPAGYTVTVSSTVAVPDNTYIVARGAVITVSGNITAFSFGKNVTWIGGEIRGPQYGGAIVYQADQICFYCSGTKNTATAPTRKIGPDIQGVTVDGFGSYAIRLMYLSGGRIANNTMSNIGYAAVGGSSVDNVKVVHNVISDISPGSGDGDSYGVFLDRENGTSETEDPRSNNCDISYNTIKNITTASNGHAIDTHAGADFTVDGNKIKNCRGGIYFTSSVISSSEALGAKRCRAHGNIMDSTGVSGGGYAAVIRGAMASGGTSIVDAAEDCSFENNTFIDCGITGATDIGAITAAGSNRCSIKNNHIIRPRSIGVLYNVLNTRLDVTGNKFVDPYSATFAAACSILVLSSDQSGNIANNEFHREDSGLATYVHVQSIRIAAGLSGLDFAIGPQTFFGSTMDFSLNTTTGVALNNICAESGTVTMPITATVADIVADITFSRPFPVIPRVYLQLDDTGSASGGSRPILTTTLRTKTGFRIWGYPNGAANFPNTGSVDVHWRATV